jgi:hypothetical protein
MKRKQSIKFYHLPVKLFNQLLRVAQNLIAFYPIKSKQAAQDPSTKKTLNKFQVN